MIDTDWDKFKEYAKHEKFTLFTNDVTDQCNSFLQARDDLKRYKVFVIRINGTERAEYVIVNEDNVMIYHHMTMQAIEDYINNELGGMKDESQ